MSAWHDKEARHQALFREVNEHIEQLAHGFGVDGHDQLVCECGNPECTQSIELTHDEYERVRAHASRFVVALNHENPETESIVEQNERFAVVETYAGASSRIARETDPRSQRELRLAEGNGGSAMSSQPQTSDGIRAAHPASDRSLRAAAEVVHRPTLLFFYSQTSGRSRRAEGFLAQVLQRRRNHDTFALVRINYESRPDLAVRCGVEQAPAIVVVDERRVRARLEHPRGCREIQSLLAPWLK